MGIASNEWAGRCVGVVASTPTFEYFYGPLGVTRESYSQFEGEWIYTYSKALQNRGWRVVVFQFSSEISSIVRTTHKSGADIYWVPCGSWSFFATWPIGGRFLSSWLTTWFSQFKNAVIASQCNILYVQEYWLSRVDAIAQMGIKLPIIAASHGEIVSHLAKPVKKFTFRAISAFTVLTPGEYRQLTGLYPEHKSKVSVIPNWIDVEAVGSRSRSTKRNCLRRLLFVGRLTHDKGLKTLIEAMTHVDAELWVIGTGPDDAILRKWAKTCDVSSRIKWLGLVPRETVGEVMSQVDVFVSCSYWEGFALAVIEAMGNGLPIVATNIAPTVDACRGYQAAILVSPGDVWGLSGALNEMLGRLDQYRHLAEHDAVWARRTYGDVPPQQLHELLLKVLGKNF